MGMTTYARELVLGDYFTGGSGLHIALHDGDPGVDGDANELTDANYARQAVTFSSIVSTGDQRSVSNTTLLAFPALAAAATVTHMTVKTAASAGDTLAVIPLLSSRSYGIGGIPNVQAGEAVIIGA